MDNFNHHNYGAFVLAIPLMQTFDLKKKKQKKNMRIIGHALRIINTVSFWEFEKLRVTSWAKTLE